MNYDISILTETWTKSDDDVSGYLDSHQHYCVHGKRRHTRGRHPGGICVFIKKELLRAITVIKTSDYGIYLKLDKDVFNFDKDIIIMCVYMYIPPEGSSFYIERHEKNGISELEGELLNIVVENMECDYMLAGDFNARTADVADFIIDDNISHIDNSDWYETDTFDLPRNSTDSRINNFGFALINMCQVYGVHMLNGRFAGDTEGSCTFISTSGTSLVDYFLVSSSLFSRIIDFTVDSRSESDHMPIVAKISCTLSDTDSQSHDQDSSYMYIHRYKWQLEFAPSFVDMLNDSSSIDSWKMFHEELNNNNTDAAVSVFVDLLQRACEPMKCEQRTYNHNHPRQSRPRRQADWWDSECSRARRCTTRLLCVYRRTRAQADLDMYCVSKRQYKSLCSEKPAPMAERYNA